MQQYTVTLLDPILNDYGFEVRDLKIDNYNIGDNDIQIRVNGETGYLMKENVLSIVPCQKPETVDASN